MPNTLIHENSPYLLGAAHQPVRWLPWSESAFQKAREENKVVLLSIGASWCHWCHVMDHESYEDPDIAELINEGFVAIKVDRDEHPEVDRRYQAALATLNGEGGWPLTAFLTPDGSLFAGGTYLPPDTRFGQKGLRTFLQEIQDSARTAGPSLQASAEQIRKMQDTAVAETAELSAEYVEHMVRLLIREFDFGHGGFGEAPRFPHPPALEVLLAASFRSRDQNQENLVRKALESMARGGIYDQLVGGFHRYAADEAWSVPHFEKMLGDNAELLKLYTRAFTFTSNPLYKETAEGIFQWVKTAMTDREGGFYNSQDADIGKGDDGGHYKWNPDEVQRILTEKEMQIVSAYYNIRNAAGGNVLYTDRSLDDISEEFKIPVTIAGSLLAAGKEKLYWARKKRTDPVTDPVLYVHSNAQMFSALLEAGHSLLLKEAHDLAYKSLDRLLAIAWTPEEGFAHCINGGKAHLRGLLEDQVFGGIALLDAHADSGDPQYLERAIQTARVLQQMHEDPLNGGFFDIAADAGRASCLAPDKPFQDSPTPAGNSTAAIFLLRLQSFTSDNAHMEAAERTLQSAAGRVKDWGVFAGTFVLAVQYLLEGEFQVFIVGESQHPDAESLRQAAWQSYRPRKQIQRLDPDVDVTAPAIQGMVEFIRRKRKPMAFVCVQGSCAAPVEEPDDLRKLMLTFNP